ncbi:MAG: 30S ribosome-binding factor RbfA [Tannerella sp.]|jgi:ribosome-binding factor A|nr:30S ribosome-binding factor RbfA [Tannerella sp.]
MESKRLSKIERLLQKELGDLFQKQTQSQPGTLISVTRVRVSADLSVAKAYLSLFPSEKSEVLMADVQKRAKTIRYELGQRVRLQLRKIPELSFFVDDSLDYLDNIDRLLHNKE